MSLSDKYIEETSRVADPSILKSLTNPLIIDVRSTGEVEQAKGGVAVVGSTNVPINVDGQPQSVHRTTAQEFEQKLKQAGIDLSTLPKAETSFITHCTKGNTDYTGRGNRAAALLRDLGFSKAYNGGSADEIRAALEMA